MYMADRVRSMLLQERIGLVPLLSASEGRVYASYMHEGGGGAREGFAAAHLEPHFPRPQPQGPSLATDLHTGPQ